MTPDLSTVTAAAAGAMESLGPETDFRVSLTNAGGRGTYPIASFTWLLLHREYDGAVKAGDLVQFVWSLTEGQRAAAALGYAPLPEPLRPWIEARLRTIAVGGVPVWPGPAGD